MKKIYLLLLLLGCCALFPITGAAAQKSSSPDNLSSELLKTWASEKYGCNIDDDGDLVVRKGDDKMFVQILPKVKLICFYRLYSSYNKKSLNEMIQLANKFNDKKRLLRVSIDPEDGSSSCDYYLPYDGGVNQKNFMSVLDWIFGLSETWEEFVLSGGKD